MIVKVICLLLLGFTCKYVQYTMTQIHVILDIALSLVPFLCTGRHTAWGQEHDGAQDSMEHNGEILILDPYKINKHSTHTLITMSKFSFSQPGIFLQDVHT